MSRPSSLASSVASAARSPRAARPVGLAVLAVLAWLLPYQLNVYWISVADIAILFALLAVGMGLVMGVAGQVNLAQIAFYGVGAYTTAILTTRDGYGFWTAAAVAMIATALTGIVVGTPALRVQSHYLGIVTLGLAVAFIDWITNAPVTNGDSGISGIPTPPLPGIDLSSQYLYYYLELIVLAGGLAFGLFIVHTPLGRRMRAAVRHAVAGTWHRFKFSALVTMDAAGPAGRRYLSGATGLMVLAPSAERPTQHQFFPAVFFSDDDRPLRPGDKGVPVVVSVPDDDARSYFRPGQRFIVWDGAEIGHGTVALPLVLQWW